jgi:peptidoglycan/LPS O-acetylase OafA/YrhL
MFLKFPHIVLASDCFYFSVTREGMVFFATTPAIIYIFRRIKYNWWTVGTWTSIILSVSLLFFYHNTGSWQMGYRFLLDFLLPVLLLMGLGIGKRPSWILIALVILSIIINVAGIYWWFTEWWCKP